MSGIKGGDVMARKNFNTTIDEKTVEAINDLAILGRSKGEVIDQAVALLVESASETQVHRWFRETWTRLDEIPDVLRTVIQEFKAAKASVSAIPHGGQQTAPNCRCTHCGSQFFSMNKFATLCSECKSTGHTGNVRDCPPCAERGTGAL